MHAADGDGQHAPPTVTDSDPSLEDAPAHVRCLAAAVDALVAASAKHHPVPSPSARHATLAPTRGWLRCMEAMTVLDPHLAEDAPHEDAAASDQVLVSACTTDALGGSRPKRRVDALLALHTAQTFPDLPATLAADPSLVLLLLDAPNVLTSMALAKAFPALGTPALAARICIPQADPAHYAQMVLESRMLLNVRFQRLDAWLDANAGGGVRVPVFFADYETSVHGRRSMRLSPLQDLQRFLRYGYAASTCLVGVTLSYRSPHKGAPSLTHDVRRRASRTLDQQTSRPARLRHAIARCSSRATVAVCRTSSASCSTRRRPWAW